MSAQKRRAPAPPKAAVGLTWQAYQTAHTVEVLRGHLVEMEVLLRDLALSGAASNEDLGVGVVKVAGEMVKSALRLERACHRIRQRTWNPPPARSDA